MDVGHIGPLMAQQTGYRKMGIQTAHTVVDQLLVLLSGIGMSKSMEGQGTIGVLLKIATIGVNEKLQLVNGPVGGHTVRYQQLVAAWGSFQLLFQMGSDAFIFDGNGAHLAALALDGDGVFFQSLLCRGSINAEALMDAQTGETAQIESQNVIPPVIAQGPAKHLVELHIAPCSVHTAEAPLLQLHAQFIIGGELILGIAHLIMEETDGRQVGLDGTGSEVVLL